MHQFNQGFLPILCRNAWINNAAWCQNEFIILFFNRENISEISIHLFYLNFGLGILEFHFNIFKTLTTNQFCSESLFLHLHYRFVLFL
jgi:hypothetical protein